MKQSEGRYMTTIQKDGYVFEVDLKKAIDSAYSLVGKINFDNAVYRKDIGARALKVGV